MDLINTLTYVTGVFVLECTRRCPAIMQRQTMISVKIVGTGLSHYLISMLPLLIVVWLIKINWPCGWLVVVMMETWCCWLLDLPWPWQYLITCKQSDDMHWRVQLMHWQVLHVLTTVLVSIVLVVYAKQGLSGVFLRQLVGAAIGLVVSMQGHYKASMVSIDWKMWKELIRFSAPLTVSAVLLYLMNYIDRWLIRDHLGLAAVGIYAVVFRIAAVPMLVMNIVSNSLLPHIYREYKDRQKAVEIGRLYNLIWSAGLLLVAWMAWLSPEVVLWMAGDVYSMHAYLFPIVLLSGFLLHYSYLFVGLYLGHKTHLTTYLYLAGLAAVYLLNTILLPCYGLAGTAISNILTTGGILVFNILHLKGIYISHTVEVNVGQWRLHHTSHSCCILSRLPPKIAWYWIAIIYCGYNFINITISFAWRARYGVEPIEVLNLLPLILNRNRSAGKLLSILREEMV